MATNFTNTATADGLIGIAPTGLTGNLTIQMVNGLALTKTANKQSWADGELIYTLTIDNQSGDAYDGVSITDILTPTIVTLVDGSVERDDETQSYTYTPADGKLIIPETGTTFDVAAGENTVITFRVTKT